MGAISHVVEGDIPSWWSRNTPTLSLGWGPCVRDSRVSGTVQAQYPLSNLPTTQEPLIWGLYIPAFRVHSSLQTPRAHSFGLIPDLHLPITAP